MINLAIKLAWRDLCGGATGLIIVLLCLGVGVASVAGIFSLRAALDQGITENSRAILGGDLELSTSLAPIPPTVAAWFTARGARVSTTIDTRSILVAPSGRRLLAAARATGPGWPLLGQVTSNPPNQFASLASGPDGRPGGLLLDPTAAASLGVRPGDPVSLGGVKLAFRGTILNSPDAIGDSRLFGVKAFVPIAALANTPLIAPGGLVTFQMQVLLPPGVSPEQTAAAFHAAFPNAVWRLATPADAAPDLANFINQAALFMALLALAALLVGGIGVANGVEAWLAARARTIATLRCLGASARLIGLTHALQLLLLGLPGIAAGLVVGALAPLAILPYLRDKLPLPAHLGLYPQPLLFAALFGLLIGALFAFRPLRRAAAISGAGLFRAVGLPSRLPFSWPATVTQAAFVAALIALAALAVPRPELVFGFCAGTVLTLLLLRAIAALLMRLLPLLPRLRDPGFALGLTRLAGPASSLPLMLLSAGAGLTVLAAVAQIRGNLIAEFSAALPSRAPSFYFLDIQPADLPLFKTTLAKTGAAHGLAIMPNLRARILAVNNTPADSFHPPEQSGWPLRGDIAFTYAATPPPGAKITAGAWWPPDYLGPPLISMDGKIAQQWGLKLGDTLTVNILGRSFVLKIASFRAIRWQSLQLNFLLIGTPDPFAGAPHTLIATVKADPGREGAVLAAVTNALPGVTGLDVAEVLHAFAGLLGEVATAVSLVGLVALLAGGLVLVSAVAAEREARIAEAVVLKTLGASQSQIRRAWLAEFAIAGGVAGLVAALLGTIAAALTIREIFNTDWAFEPLVLLVTILGSIALMLALGYISTARALRQPAAPILRQSA